jgi:hypothetical protein
VHGLAEPTREVPLKLLLPLAEAGAVEEDDLLRKAWARMWVNAADADSAVEVRRAYVSILSECTQLDIRVLATLHNVEPELRMKWVRSGCLPGKAVQFEDEFDVDFPRPLALSLWNLRRLGLIASFGDWDNPGGTSAFQICIVSITDLGIGLVEACTLRDRNGPAQVTSGPPT